MLKFLFSFILPIAIVIAGIFLIKKKFFLSELRRSFHYSLFLVTVPRDLSKEEEQKKLIDFIAPFEQLIEGFSRYKKDIILEIAVPHNSEEICFYIAINRNDAQLLEKSVTSLFPHSRVESAKDYTIFSPRGETRGATFRLKNPYVLPLKTFSVLSEDVLSSVLSAFKV